MVFDKEKKKYLDALYKHDNSRKGSVDDQIKYVVDEINNLRDYYTTSSCAGRIVIIELPINGKKNEAKWLFTSHEAVKELNLEELNFSSHPAFFKQESFIIHLCARNLDSANKLINKAREAGFKRGGIISANKRIMMEILGTNQITAPVYYDDKIMVSKEYFELLLKIGNKNLETSREKLKKFYELIKKA
ncbi:hypothetical protein GOV05_04890 [Candidatus Woesearchaeota archaeon]|nr:hypothetical protein [Candidatus Woesearchaeota archaeon]